MKITKNIIGVIRICKNPDFRTLEGRDFIFCHENSSPRLKSNSETPSSEISSICDWDFRIYELPKPARTMPALR
jgi:hypothetical protein